MLRHEGHLVRAHLTCTHTWEFPHHPYRATAPASGVQSQICCRARQGEITGIAALQRALIGSLGVTVETRPALGNFGKANTGGTARVGTDCRRHHGLPSAVSSSGDCGLWALSALRAAWDSVTSSPAPTSPALALLVPLRAAAFDIGLAAPPAAPTASLWDGFGEIRALEGSDSTGSDFHLLYQWFGQLQCTKMQEEPAAPCKSKTCFGESKSCSRGGQVPPRCPHPAHPADPLAPSSPHSSELLGAGLCV